MKKLMVMFYCLFMVMGNYVMGMESRNIPGARSILDSQLRSLRNEQNRIKTRLISLREELKKLERIQEDIELAQGHIYGIDGMFPVYTMPNGPEKKQYLDASNRIEEINKEMNELAHKFKLISTEIDQILAQELC